MVVGETKVEPELLDITVVVVVVLLAGIVGTT
jgi:hypothetical protein